MAGGIALVIHDLLGLLTINNVVVFGELLLYHAASVAQQLADFKYYTLAKTQKIW